MGNHGFNLKSCLGGGPEMPQSIGLLEEKYQGYRFWVQVNQCTHGNVL